MAWNPDVYNQFKDARHAPFYDLFSLVEKRDRISVIDLGCGTGELTKFIADNLQGSSVLGIDDSAEMLTHSANFVSENLQFRETSVQSWLMEPQTVDLVISNAALQWVPDHQLLIPDIIRKLNAGGQLAVQVPAQNHNKGNLLLNELAGKEPYKTGLNEWSRISSVLEIDEYARILYENGGRNIQALERIYPLVLENSEALFTWLTGSTLIPFLEKLSLDLRDSFREDFRLLLKNEFPGTPVFYPFRRIFFSAVFN